MLRTTVFRGLIAFVKKSKFLLTLSSFKWCLRQKRSLHMSILDASRNLFLKNEKKLCVGNHH